MSYYDDPVGQIYDPKVSGGLPPVGRYYAGDANQVRDALIDLARRLAHSSGALTATVGLGGNVVSFSSGSDVRAYVGPSGTIVAGLNSVTGSVSSVAIAIPKQMRIELSAEGNTGHSQIYCDQFSRVAFQGNAVCYGFFTAIGSIYTSGYLGISSYPGGAWQNGLKVFGSCSDISGAINVGIQPYAAHLTSSAVRVLAVFSNAPGSPTATSQSFAVYGDGRTEINLLSGSGNVLEVKNQGALKLFLDGAGALTLTSGALTLTSGALTLTSGTLVLTSGTQRIVFSGSLGHIGTAGDQIYMPLGVDGGSATSHFGAISSNTQDRVIVRGRALDGDAAVGVVLDNLYALTSTSAKLVSVQNATVEQAYFGRSGSLTLVGPASGTNALEIPFGSRMSFKSGTTEISVANIAGGYLDIMQTGTNGTKLRLRSSDRNVQFGTNHAGDGLGIDGNLELYRNPIQQIRFRNNNATSIIADIIGTVASQSLSLRAYAPSGTAVSIDSMALMTSSNDRLLSIRNSGSERAYVDMSGAIYHWAVWDDLQGPVERAGGVAALTFDAYAATPMKFYCWRHDQSEPLYMTYQMSHGWATGTQVRPHIHLIPLATPASDQTIVLTGSYAWTRVSGGLATGSWTDFSASLTIFSGGSRTNSQELISLFQTTPTAEFVESSILCLVVRRDVAGADTYTTNKASGVPAANVALLSIDAHILKSKIGTHHYVPGF